MTRFLQDFTETLMWAETEQEGLEQQNWSRNLAHVLRRGTVDVEAKVVYLLWM